ncbi:dephospho-CoA kinase [Planctomicrobium sp. SH668]|uniref:dephospho-CoA kinase n=1 Tax=Planctomicrobium sp. SH668 TaxID=3448126 RepID=UPI003F5B9A96
MSAARIPVIGIVGGIGSGKSALAIALNQHFQCARLDADASGHRALLLPKVVTAITSAFGDQILDGEGNIARPELAKLVFGTTEKHIAARKKLEQIVYPYIRSDIVKQLEQHQSDSDCDLILLDAALLLESGWSNDCDAIIFVDVPDSIRKARVKQRGWSQEHLRQREASQLSLEEKKSRSDLIVDNSGDIDETARIVGDWIKQRFQLETDVEVSRTSR